MGSLHLRDELHPGSPGSGDEFQEVKLRPPGAQPQHSLSLCLLQGKLNRAGLNNHDITFWGDIWHCQECISL